MAWIFHPLFPLGGLMCSPQVSVVHIFPDIQVPKLIKSAPFILEKCTVNTSEEWPHSIVYVSRDLCIKVHIGNLRSVPQCLNLPSKYVSLFGAYGERILEKDSQVTGIESQDHTGRGNSVTWVICWKGTRDGKEVKRKCVLKCLQTAEEYLSQVSKLF